MSEQVFTERRPSGRWSTRKTVAAVALAAALAVGGGVAVAATGNDGSTAGAQTGGKVPGGPGGMTGQGGQLAPPGGQQAGGPGGLANALHGELVVADGNGGYSTERIQTGTVSAVSASAITLKSEDGFSATYALDSSTTVAGGTVGAVQTGHTVSLTATNLSPGIGP